MENRVIKFRVWKPFEKVMFSSDWLRSAGVIYGALFDASRKDIVVMQWTGLKDKNGKEIYEGDILEFTDKWQWYKTSYGIKMRFAEPERRAELQKQYDAEPMERRVIQMPECYEWILSSEIQTYWAVVGNLYQHPSLLNQPKHQTL